MPAVKPYATPWEGAQALVQEHALNKYGIVDADPLKLVVELAFAPSEAKVAEDGTVYWTGSTPELRLASAKTLLKYTRPEVKAVQVQFDGQVDVTHSHLAIDATAKARTLLELLGSNKYVAGQLTHLAAEAKAEAEVVEIPPEASKH